MSNPLLVESPYPYGAPQFDKIKTEHYLPAFKQGIVEAKADIDNIVNCPDAPTFANTIEALEFSGRTLGRVSDIFFNILEKNYTILSGLVSDKISSIGRDELMLKGFNPEYVTGCMRMNKRELCYCYDIAFVRTPSRIYNLRRIAGKVTCG